MKIDLEILMDLSEHDQIYSSNYNMKQMDYLTRLGVVVLSENLLWYDITSKGYLLIEQIKQLKVDISEQVSFKVTISDED
jgi:predicted transcriptional regulator